jgi:hypothetical protein
MNITETYNLKRVQEANLQKKKVQVPSNVKNLTEEIFKKLTYEVQSQRN